MEWLRALESMAAVALVNGFIELLKNHQSSKIGFSAQQQKELAQRIDSNVQRIQDNAGQIGDMRDAGLMIMQDLLRHRVSDCISGGAVSRDERAGLLAMYGAYEDCGGKDGGLEALMEEFARIPPATGNDKKEG